MPILVTGGPGYVGGEVVRQLARNHIEVRAMVRDLSKASAIRGNGVEIVMGDLSKPGTLDAALTGMDRVLLSSAPGPKMVALQSNMVEAAKRAGVRHLVKISAMGADLNSPVSLGRWHAQIEERLATSGVPFTNFRPNLFMQSLLDFAPTMSKQGVFYGLMKDSRASFVDVRDIGTVAVAVLTSGRHEGQTYEVTGPDALSLADAARRLSVVTGRAIRYVDVPPATFIEKMREAGMPQWLAEDRAALHQLLREALGAAVTDVVRRIARKQPIAFADFAREFARAFGGRSPMGRFAACL